MTEYIPHDVEWTPEKIARFWDHYGSVPALRPLYFSAHSGREIVARADAELGLAGKRILDFGAGNGDLLAHLFARGIAASALEFSERSAAGVRARFEREPRLRGVEIGADAYADASFDVVFLVEVVEHLLEDQVEPTVCTVERLLAPGGHVVVTAPNAEDLLYEHAHCPDCGATFHRWQHQRSVTPAGVVQMFRGFAPVRAEALNWQEGWRARAKKLMNRPVPRPHLFYVGRRADTPRPVQSRATAAG